MKTAQQKRALRNVFRAKRNALSQREHSKNSQEISTHLEQLLAPYHTITAYLANDAEPDISAFISASWKRKKRILLPVLHPFTPGYVMFQRYQSCTEMGKNRFAIEEPQLDCSAIVPTNQIDVVLLPLVAFDSNKNRLGMGGGFYDRTLAKVCSSSKRPIFIGIAHDCQYSSAILPTEPWDIPLDHIVTPDNII